jgi:lipid-A-disaccharide synthase-like uncharacterized protein
MSATLIAESWSPWELIGAAGQALFFGRVLVQWIASEREKRSANPRSFWWLSLAASALLSVATLGLQEWVLLPGYLVNAAIYTRNLTLAPGRPSRLGPVPAALLGLGAAAVLMAWGITHTESEGSVALPWLAAGLVGQAIWSTRFILQWWLSERAGYSHFPLAFWWLSLVGSLLNLAYTLQLDTPIFWVGFVTAWFVPARNLMLELRHRRAAASAPRGPRL